MPSDIQVIENFVKNVKNINSEDIELSRLPQSKFYLKIIGISYLIENSNVSISSDFVETIIIKSNHVFNNLSLYQNCESLKLCLNLIWLSSELTYEMLKVSLMLKILSTSLSILEAILQLSEVQI